MGIRPQLKLWVVLCALVWQGAYASFEVTDDFDRLIVLESPATRIVSLAPHNTENLFSAGLGDRIVGVDEHSHYPDAARGISIVGSAVQINIEAIIQLKPDLIVVWQGASNKDKLEKLAELGFTLYYSEPRSFEDIIGNIEDFAVLGGSTRNIIPSPLELQREIELVKEKYQNLESQSVFYQVWTNPLITLNGTHFISRVLDLCGAKNIFSNLTIIAPRVSVEAVVQANPDIIITGDSGDVEAGLAIWRPWKSITAVAKNNYLLVNSDVMHRHTARMIMGIRELCEGIDTARQGADSGQLEVYDF